MDTNSESSTSSTVEQKIIALAQGKPKGISGADISKEIPDLSPGQLAAALNKLLSQGQVTLFQKGSVLLYKLNEVSKTQPLKGADNEEKIVYSIIEEAGNKGIWMRNIRLKSNLMHTQLNKILKSLETKKFIKAVKSVAASKKKLYMLYNLEPDKSVTGGTFYQDQDFEAEFVDILNQQCYRFLEQKNEAAKDFRGGPIAARNKAFASCNEVRKFINDLGISKVKLSEEDLEMILNTLVYDGKVQKTISTDGSTLYRAVQFLVPTPGIMKTPCGLCPVKNNCCDLGDVTPIKCQYFTDWLDML
ncbi:probable DNA-directed RNA polymerase III subunit RPC6 [Chelonus insularis]|uniref:probable DNA-directed RNA polymerase III subunit RPC6 n=1 Tax=Chelonus insularis TaxID=460826 RepID=UPI00158CCCC9|nr:probable DNA-directed RNA polymerase III subunit RPC6 [Chelonus insularis]